MNAITEIGEIKKIFKGALAYLENKKEEINNLNVFPVPDGDTGTNMYLTMYSAIKTIDDSEPKNFTEFAEALSKGALLGARGNSGVILSQIFRGIAVGMHGKRAVDGKVLNECFKLGTEIAYKAVKKPVKGTILTVMDGISEGATEALKKQDDIYHVLEHSIVAGKIALEETPNLLPVLKEAGVVDAGGYGLLIIIEGMYKTAIGESLIFDTKEMVIDSPIVDQSYQNLDEIKYTYCTEFIILEPKVDNDSLRNKLDSPDIGDSLVTIVADGIAKVHIHTNIPGTVLDYALSVGNVTNIKIDNMKEQFLAKNKKVVKKPIKFKEYGFVMVVPGAGLAEIAKSMGVDAVLDGGQTMNPSTHDIQQAIDAVPAKIVYVFPNNKNIILAAEQTIALNNDKKIVVVPSINVQQGFTSILSFNEEKNSRENLLLMKEAFATVDTGAITYAVRDTQNNGLKIKKDQILTIRGNSIIASKNTVDEAVDEYLNQAYDNHEIMTIYYGDKVSKAEADKLKDRIESKYKELDVLVYEGKQPVYFYFLSLE
ncbi:MAG: DAK2 domain-containing protein [Firmicutes bacterium]|nr:DAK2 domain-containing protein [Bacillota bacterium]